MDTTSQRARLRSERRQSLQRGTGGRQEGLQAAGRQRRLLGMQRRPLATSTPSTMPFPCARGWCSVRAALRVSVFPGLAQKTAPSG